MAVDVICFPEKLVGHPIGIVSVLVVDFPVTMMGEFRKPSNGVNQSIVKIPSQTLLRYFSP